MKLALGLFLALATPAVAETYVVGTVVQVQAKWEEVTQTVEYQDCSGRLGDRTPPGLTPPPNGQLLRGLAGAVIGGVIGNQFGNGTGRDAATAFGAVVGGAIGARTGCDTVLVPETTRVAVDYYIVYELDGRYYDGWSYTLYRPGDDIYIPIGD